MNARGPIFLISRFRSGSSFLWNLFRHDERYRCFYEPFHDNLKECVQTETPVLESHRGISQYWSEYAPLRNELGEIHQSEFGIYNLFLRSTDRQPKLAEYVHRLIQVAEAENRTCVIKCNRLDFRLPWLLANFPTAQIIYTVRNPRDQWISSLHTHKPEVWDRLEENTGYDLPLWVADLASSWPFLLQGPKRPAYYYSYLIWKLSLVFGQALAHLCLDFDRDIVADPKRLQRSLAQFFPADYFSLPVVAALFLPPRLEIWRKHRSEAWFQDLEGEAELTLQQAGVYKEELWKRPYPGFSAEESALRRAIGTALLTFSAHRGDLLVHHCQMDHALGEAKKHASSLQLSADNSAEALREAEHRQAESDAHGKIMAGRIAELESAALEQKRAITKLELTLRETETHLERAASAHADLEGTHAATINELGEMSQARAILQRANTENQEALGRKIADHEELQRSYEETSNALAETKQDQQRLVSQLSEAQRQRANLAGQLAAARTSITELEEQVRSNGVHNEEMGRKLTQMTEELARENARAHPTIAAQRGVSQTDHTEYRDRGAGSVAWAPATATAALFHEIEYLRNRLSQAQTRVAGIEQSWLGWIVKQAVPAFRAETRSLGNHIGRSRPGPVDRGEATGSRILSKTDPSPASSPPRTKVAAFTIISNNYSAHARVLMQSLAAHEPGWDRWVLLVDKPPAEPLFTSDQAQIKLATELPIPTPETFFLRYDILEANTAVKPWMIDWLWTQGYEWVVYFDPDTRLFSPLIELKESFPRASVILTPHITRPYADDFQPGELLIKRTGTFNLGFAALKNDVEGRKIVTWWQGKLAEKCVNALDRGIFVDQSWMTFCPVYCDRLLVLKHPGYNVAYWNLHYRELADVASGGRAQVGKGIPLRFFHFSGFDYRNPRTLSKHQNRFKDAALSEELRTLLQDYASALIDAGIESISQLPYGLGHAELPRQQVAPAFESPCFRPVFHGENAAPTTDEWRDYLLSPDLRNAALPVFLANTWYRRPDLHAVFDLGTKAGRSGFFRWFDETGRKDEKLPADFPAWGWWADRDLPRPLLVDGKPMVTVYGYFEAVSGVGEAARSSVRALQRLKFPHRIVNFSVGDESRKQRPNFRFNLPASSGAIDLIHVNCDQAGVFLKHHPEVLQPWRYRIGYWAWEKDELPPDFYQHASHFDEIWCLSETNARVFRTGTRQPVRVAWPNLDVGAIAPTIACAQLSQLPARTKYFLTLADFHSFPERKGPLTTVLAFSAAFPDPVPGIALVVKVANQGFRADYWQKLQTAANGRADIVFLTESLDRAQLNRLIADAHALVSLHTQEGFGLPIAEAIAMGVPVVCTNFGGNTDFCTSENAHLVPYQLTVLTEDIGPYRAGTQWAQPDIAAAAEYMQRLAAMPQRPSLESAPPADIVSHRSYEMYAANLAAVTQIINDSKGTGQDTAAKSPALNLLHPVFDRFELGDGTLDIAGWSIMDIPAQTSVQTTALLRNGEHCFQFPLRRVPRVDVARHFQDATRLSSGFAGTINLAALPPGSYELELLFRSNEGHSTWRTNRTIDSLPSQRNQNIAFTTG